MLILVLTSQIVYAKSDENLDISDVSLEQSYGAVQVDSDVQYYSDIQSAQDDSNFQNHATVQRDDRQPYSSIEIAVQKNGVTVNKLASPPQKHILNQHEIKKELDQIKVKMQAKIERWGNALTAKDIHRKGESFFLNINKQVEVCQILQNVINETYLLVQSHKQLLTGIDQEILNNRKQFIRSVGFSHNIIRTQFGFDCLML